MNQHYDDAEEEAYENGRRQAVEAELYCGPYPECPATYTPMQHATWRDGVVDGYAEC